MFFILSLLWTATAFGQRSVLRGTVTDSITGESLPFASLVWQGTTVGTKADVDGHYSLSSPVAAPANPAATMTAATTADSAGASQ